jgi:chemotaxis protein MotB
MKNFKIAALLLLTVIASTAGCVSKKKFLTELARRQQSCDSTSQVLNGRIGRLAIDTTLQGENIRKQRAQYQSLDRSYNQLLSNSASETANLSRDLQQRQTDLESTQKTLAAREARVQELQKVLADKEKAVQDLRNKVQNALLSFKASDLTVQVKNGKVYVSLSEQLLFKSGSYAVDPKGQDAIKKLALAIKDNADINVTVEGHTDDVAITAGTVGLKDNWDLSVLRATSIARQLTAEGVPGARLIASGRSEFLALEPGKTPEIRQRNRRTEIILTPKLDELLQILQQ